MKEFRDRTDKNRQRKVIKAVEREFGLLDADETEDIAQQ